MTQMPSRPTPGIPGRPGGAGGPQAPNLPGRPGTDGPAAAPAGPVMPPSAPAGPVSAPSAASSGVRREAAVADHMNLDELLEYMVNANGSDLHLSVGTTPMIRVYGEMTPIPGKDVITPEMMEEALRKMVKPELWQKFEKEMELDFAYTLEGVARFRGNFMRQRGVPGGVFRIIPWEIKPLEALGIPTVVNSFTSLPRGLVLVTGPTGSGKTTTLAAMIDRANRTRSGHIITVEDPIEFIHPHRSCVVNQREVGNDTESFTAALKHILRQDPDIILVGEMRDLETISIALTAAETGHLVFGTLHTQSAQDTVNRVIDVFPPEQQGQIRTQLAATLKGVICQSLVKTSDGKGRVPAVEIMVVNSAIAAMIRRGETHQIPQAIQSGGKQGMITLNQNLANLVRSGDITRDQAIELAQDVKELETLLSGGTSNVQPVRDLGSISTGGLSGASI